MDVAEGAQHRQAGVVGDSQSPVARRGAVAAAFDELPDVGYLAHGVEEARVRSRHVASHVLDEVVLRCGAASTNTSTLGVGRRRCICFLAGGAVLDAENDVEELDEAALGVARPAVLDVLGRSRAVVPHDAVGQAGLGHVLASG